MFKKLTAFVMALCVIGGTALYAPEKPLNIITANAVVYKTEVTEGFITYKISEDEDHAILHKCDQSAEGEITIPAEINGVPVTRIDWGAFYKCTGLTSINIPDSIIYLGTSAFADCTGLTSINIPDSVTSIENGAFSGCTELTSINIPDSVTNIGIRAFDDTKWLENKRKENPLVIVNDIIIDGRTYTENTLNIPENIKIIASEAFKGTNLTSINFPDSMTNISGCAFSGCESLASITIPYNITSIGASAFRDCTNLTDITISNPDCEIYDFETTISNRTVSKKTESVDSEGNVSFHRWSGGEFDGTIHGYANSTAQAYAEKYGYKFAVIGDEAPAVYLAGDANGDGKTSISDAVRILQYVSNKEKYNLSGQALENADVYNKGDGITGMDAASIQRLDAGVIDSLPESVMEK